MVIICQNINQSKRWKSGFKYADDLTTNENCYNKLLILNPDIIILTEVTYPESVQNSLNQYKCYFNQDRYTSKNFLYNKIFIGFKESFFKEISDVCADETNNDFEHCDYLKIMFKYKNEKCNVIGLRLHHDYTKETNDIHNKIIESILKENVGIKTIIAGDFNNGFIAEEIGNYPKYKFNIHTLKRLCNMKFHYREPQYKLVTVPSLNVDDKEPINVNNYDSKEWTHKLNAPPRPIDHFIISKSFNNYKYELIEDPDGVDKIYETTYGIPDHRIIKLTINE